MFKESVPYVIQAKFFRGSLKFLNNLKRYGSEAFVVMIKPMNKDFVKLDRFDETNFTRWQDKLKFLLPALKIFYVLDLDLKPIYEPINEDFDELKAERKKRIEDELIYHRHILNALFDPLYDLYTDTRSAREIWKILKFKYKADEEGTKKFLIAKYFNLKMVDYNSILAQVHELQVLVKKMRAVKIDNTDTFQVGAIIEKFKLS